MILKKCITNCNTLDITLNTLFCLKALTKNNYKVLIGDIKSDLKDYLTLKRKILNYYNVELYRADNLNIYYNMAYLAHGLALNDLISRIDTKYGAVMDSDFTFIH